MDSRIQLIQINVLLKSIKKIRSTYTQDFNNAYIQITLACWPDTELLWAFTTETNEPPVIKMFRGH